MATLKLISIDTSDLERFGADLAKLSPEDFAEGVVVAVNEVTDRTYALSRKTILAGINLTDQYVQRKMGVQRATSRNPKAEIAAFGGKGFITSLSHYGQIQRTQPVRWKNSTIANLIGTIGPGGFPWTRRTGDPARGIAANKKQDGISVEVVRNKRLTIGAQSPNSRPAFTLPGKRDSDGNPLIAKRVPGTRRKVDVLTGPSVYQLFAVAIPKIEDDVAEDLQETVRESALRQLRESLL